MLAARAALAGGGGGGRTARTAKQALRLRQELAQAVEHGFPAFCGLELTRVARANLRRQRLRGFLPEGRCSSVTHGGPPVFGCGSRSVRAASARERRAT